MKDILLVSGCSWGDVNWTAASHPDMDCDWPKWPEILAEKVNMECINLCKSGAGQEYIYSSLIDKIQTLNTNRIGLVLPAWTTAPRRDYQLSTRITNNRYWTNDSTDVKGCIEYWVDRSIRYYYSFQNVCENLKVPYRQVQILNLYRGYIWEQIAIERAGHLHQKQYHFKHKNWQKEQEHVGWDLGIPNTNDQLTTVEMAYKHESAKKLRKQMVENPYYNKINSNFLGWPTEKDLEVNAFALSDDWIGVERISKLDLHPNAKGQEQIAQFIFDKLGYSKGMNKIGVYI